MAEATTGQPIAPSRRRRLPPPIIAVIGQPIVPPSTEAIGSPEGLRSTVLVGAEPLVMKQVAYTGTFTSIDGVSGPAALAY